MTRPTCERCGAILRAYGAPHVGCDGTAPYGNNPTPAKPPEPEDIAVEATYHNYDKWHVRVAARAMLAALEWAFNGYGELNVLPDDVKLYRAELRKKVEG